MNKKEMALKLLENLRMSERIVGIVIEDYDNVDPTEMIIHIDTKSKTVSQFNHNSLSQNLFRGLQKEFNVKEPVEVFYKANEPIYYLLNSLLGTNSDEDICFDLDRLEEMIKEL